MTLDNEPDMQTKLNSSVRRLDYFHHYTAMIKANLESSSIHVIIPFSHLIYSQYWMKSRWWTNCMSLTSTIYINLKNITLKQSSEMSIASLQHLCVQKITSLYIHWNRKYPSISFELLICYQNRKSDTV